MSRTHSSPACSTLWGVLAGLIVTAGCGSSKTASGQGGKPDFLLKVEPTSLVVERFVEEFGLSEAKRILAPGLDEMPSSVHFGRAWEAKSLGEESDTLGRLYAVSGDFDARDEADVPHRYRWSAIVGVRDLILTLAKLEVSQQGEELRTVYTEPSYVTSSRDDL